MFGFTIRYEQKQVVHVCAPIYLDLYLHRSMLGEILSHIIVFKV